MVESSGVMFSFLTVCQSLVKLRAYLPCAISGYCLHHETERGDVGRIEKEKRRCVSFTSVTEGRCKYTRQTRR